MNRARKRTGLPTRTSTSHVCKGGIACQARASWRRSPHSTQRIGVMPDTRGRGAESTVRIWNGTRDARSLPKELREIGEPCARKPARTVRRGEVEKGLAEIPPEGISGRSKASHSTSSAPYPTTDVPSSWSGRCFASKEGISYLSKVGEPFLIPRPSRQHLGPLPTGCTSLWS